MAEPPLRRPTCPRCALPLRTCLCALVRPVDNVTGLLILQHPGERHQAKNSARLLQLCLQRSELRVGERFEPAELAPLLADAVLLYPGDSPRPRPARSARPGRLVVLDATWRKSRRMLALNPLLQALPRLSWAAPPAPRYAALRRAEKPGQLSTLEAAALGLAELDGAAVAYAPLWDAFEAWLGAQAAHHPTRG
jgi:DTW domain-containing protein YfiP